MRHALICHPRTPTAAVRAITVDVARSAAGALRLGFALDGTLARIRIPDAGPARPGRDLWRHTCFEAFVGTAGTAAYHELNLSPSGEWTVFAFRSYRDGGPLDAVSAAPRTRIQRSGERLGLDADVDLAALAPVYRHAPLRIGLAAVVEARDGTLSYWALRHPTDAPDFHHADAFALALEPSPDAC